MANQDNRTVFQRLTDVLIGLDNSNSGRGSLQSVTYNMTPNDAVLYSFQNKQERDQKALELKQQKLLGYQWKKSGYDTTMQQLAGATQVKVMYRDADLMCQWPEIKKALDIISEEATCIKEGRMLNIYSKSPRIKAILEDLFINRLNIHVILPEIVHEMCKYGNDFRLLNISAENGVQGWRLMPVHEMRRIENGLQNIYGGATMNANLYNLKPDETKFIWEGHNENEPFKNWQIAHFRLIRDAIYLPYGSSVLNPARRFWRILSIMEDGLLLHRVEKSVERRIFKVNVGAIDIEDVPAFLQDFANTFKRAPMIDPQTGQLDLRKNFLDVSSDFFLPVRDGQDPTSIETLQGLNSQLQMDDINYMQNKLLTAMGVPKSFLNFQDSQGKQQNLSLQDIRFCRSINYYQQVVLMELNKIAIIHLYLLGFREDLTNFTLTLNNPSNQIEMMELDNMAKRITNATSALADPGGGIPLMSWHQVQKEIMGKTDAEIATTLNELRLEKAIAAELQLTSQIIEKTNVFDKVDRIYGKPGAKYDYNALGEGSDMGGGGGGMPSLGGGSDSDFGSDLGGLDEPGNDLGGDISGTEGAEDLGTMDTGGSEPQVESYRKDDGRELIVEHSKNLDNVIEEYMRNVLKLEEVYVEPRLPKITHPELLINEEITKSINELNKIGKNKTKLDNLLD